MKPHGRAMALVFLNVLKHAGLWELCWEVKLGLVNDLNPNELVAKRAGEFNLM